VGESRVSRLLACTRQSGNQRSPTARRNIAMPDPTWFPVVFTMSPIPAFVGQKADTRRNLAFSQKTCMGVVHDAPGRLQKTRSHSSTPLSSCHIVRGGQAGRKRKRRLNPYTDSWFPSRLSQLKPETGCLSTRIQSPASLATKARVCSSSVAAEQPRKGEKILGPSTSSYTPISQATTTVLGGHPAASV